LSFTSICKASSYPKTCKLKNAGKDMNIVAKNTDQEISGKKYII